MEIKIFLLIYTIILLINYIRKPKYNILCCGLWCYVGDEPADPMKMKILALYNLSRGDHATGICINNAIVKDTQNAKEFLKEHGSLLDLSPEMTNFTILGHCRQATAAYDKTNKNFAHPHKIVGDNGALLYLVHNGTVTNIDDLCSKYKIDSNFHTFSDSIQIAKMIAKTWEAGDKTIFKDYEGSATLVFYPHGTTNMLYVHRDSLRELFYWRQSEHSVYISSIKDALMIIGAEEEEVIEFKHGILTEFTGANITNEWDYSDKKPYNKPKVYTSTYPQKPTKIEKTKNGFYWDNHLIFFNGHAYTGDFYLKGRHAVQFSNDPDYTKIFCFQGVVMKNESTFNDLKLKCTGKAKVVDPKIFKKMTPLEVSKYSLYPVAGGFGNSSNNQAFWTPELFALQKDPEKTHTWSPPLSNQIFEIYSNGTLKCSKFGGTLLSVKEFIQERVDQKAKTGTFYNTIGEFFSEFKDTSKINVKGESFDNFCDAVFEFMRETNYLTTAEESEIQRTKTQEFDYKGYFEKETYPESLTNFLKKVCKAGADLREDIEEEAIEPDSALSDTDWYKTTYFRNQVLFGNFESFDDLMENHVQTDDGKYVRPFFTAIAQLFCDIGWASSEDVIEAKQRSLNDVKFTLSRFYDNLKAETFFVDLLESYSGSDKDLYDTIANMYHEIDAISQKDFRTSKDETHLSVYKLCLAYILNGTKTLNETKLVTDYQLTRTELETICQ